MAAHVERFPMAETPQERAIRQETEANVIIYAQAIERRRKQAPERIELSRPLRLNGWWIAAFLFCIAIYCVVGLGFEAVLKTMGVL